LLEIKSSDESLKIKTKYIAIQLFAQDSWGRVITLTGTHAFEYTIHIEGIRTVTETFVNGKLARKRFNELKRKP
jgi:hypothetical protein